MAKKKKNFLNLNNIKKIITNKKVILVFIILLAILFRLYFNPMDIDDAPITYKYAENIVAGKGFVYNEGERVLGTTTPLFTLILAGFIKLGFEVFFTSNLLGLISAVVSIILVYLIFKDNKMEYAGLIAAFILAVLNDFVIYTMNGMETSFYIMLIMLSFYLYSKEKYIWCGFVLGLTFLTRPDGLILVAVIFGHYLLTKRKIPWKMGAVFVVTVLPWLIFAITYFGSFLPQSLIGKQLQGNAAKYPFLLRLAGFFFDRSYILLLPFFLIGINFLIKNKDMLIYFLWFMIYIIGYTLIGIDAYAWYFIPLIPVFVMFSVLGINNVKDYLSKEKNKIIKNAIKLFPIFLCIIILPISSLGMYHYKTKVDPNWRNYKTVSLWIGKNTEENSTLMHGAIGYVGYYGKKKIIDTAFLVTELPKNVEDDIVKEIFKRNYTALYTYYKPDYVIFRDIPGVDEFKEIPKVVQDDYNQVKNFTFTRIYTSEDFRFRISYKDYWAIYKRK